MILIYEIHVEERKGYYGETCLRLTLNKPKSCINRILNKVRLQEIFGNLTCITQTPVYSERKSWSQGGLV